ncbi:hypothetical protein C8R44DRAFT_759903 [Mycena epipterygia]|nr:hypothetical protein C8R44DRAFT_759903 [Mycena epipterygia]
MRVDFGLGMILRPDKTGSPSPQISAILRHQIMLWVHDPKLRTQAQGVLLLISTYIPDARTNERLTAQEVVTAKVNVPWDQEPPVAAKDVATYDVAAMSVSAAALDKSKKKRPSSFIGKLVHRVRSSVPQSDEAIPRLPMYETVVSRGWDTTNMRWKNVIWPTLDQDFQPVHTNKSKRAAWKLDWHTHRAQIPAAAAAGTTAVSPRPEPPVSNHGSSLHTGGSLLFDGSQDAATDAATAATTPASSPHGELKPE